MTPKQSQIFDWLKEWFIGYAYGPSYPEIMAGTGINSRSGLYRYLECLERDGHITQIKYQARSIRLVTKDDMRELLRTIQRQRNALNAIQRAVDARYEINGGVALHSLKARINDIIEGVEP